MRNDLIGRIEDVAGRAVVLLELDDEAAGEILLKFENIADIRAAPAVNGLIVVAHDADVLLLAGQQTHQLVLRKVGVLIFVYQYIVELAPVIFQHRRMRREQLHGFHDEVVEIERIVGAQRLFIALVDLGDLGGAHIASRFLEPLGGR